MIAVYPMLTTSDVQSHVLSGVCKVLERFVILYDMDSLADKFHLGKKVTFGADVLGKAAQVAGLKIPNRDPKQESYSFLGEADSDLPDLQGYPEFGPTGRGKENAIEPKYKETKEEREAREKRDEDRESHKREMGKGLKAVEIEFPKQESLTVEPTWVIVTTPHGTQVLGIKVIPYPIKSTEQLGKMLMTDMSLKKLDAYMYGTARKMVKVLYWAARGMIHKLPFHLEDLISLDHVISGDPEKDIIFGSTKYESNVFCLLNSQDLEHDIHFKNAGGISKLFQLGWNSIIINDDVNKRTSFCMKQFGGLCSSVSHQFLFSSFGKENDRVYEKLEDIQKVTTPFFRSKINPSKIFGESLSSEKLLKYSDYSDCNSCFGVK